MNTVVTNEITGASLASNQITLPTGTYWIDAHSAYFLVANVQLRLQNITDASTTLTGIGLDDGDAAGGMSPLRGRFTIAAQKVFEIQHRCGAGQTTNGFGDAGSFGTEVYSDICIWKVA